MPVLPSVDALLADDGVELVVVAAPNAVHYELAAAPRCGPGGTWWWTSR